MDPYTTLGIAHGSSEQDAKRAFHTLAKTCHPDLHPNNAAAEMRFKEINAAYDAICNPIVPPTQPEMHFSWRTFGGGEPFDDIFANVFNSRPKNADAYLECRLTLEEAFQGKEITVGIPVNKPSRMIKVAIPAGVAHGMRIRVQNGGHSAHPTLPPGDLFLMVSIAHNDRFTRIANNLHVTVPVSVFDVLLCREVELSGIDGRMLRVVIPPMFDMRKLRLAGHGMPDPHTGMRGDLLVDLFIQYPTLTEEQQTMLRQVEAAPKN